MLFVGALTQPHTQPHILSFLRYSPDGITAPL